MNELQHALLWTIVAATSAAGGVALCVAAAALLPARVERCALALARRPALCPALGLPLGVAAFVAIVRVGQGLPGEAQRLAVVALAALCLLAVPGLAAIAVAIGRRLGADDPAPAALRGAPVLAVACAIPLPGWYLLLPLALGAGLGSLLLRVSPGGR